jgi:ABC-type multidrug transport system ATPase subunit
MVTAARSGAISVQNLVHKLGNFTLGKINLDIMPGQCISLVGGNGAGKSTLLRCMAGLITPERGRVQLSGNPAVDIKGRKLLSYLPERFLPPHYLTGREFLDFHLGLCGVADKVQASLLDTLCLSVAVLDKPVRKLSKGTAQKLGLAAALSVMRPILLLDEPFSGLDPEAREGLRNALTHYASQGNCVLFSTHQFESMSSYVDRLLIIHEGLIRFDGAPSVCLQATVEISFERAFLKFIHAA